MLHAPSGFDPELVEQTLAALTEHHDALRMVYQRITAASFNITAGRMTVRSPFEWLTCDMSPTLKRK
ncbi:hypothetical protein PO124_23550 [Bacillus licheniformis]|nr:hypothetical protein [Bacillus licheniformis]